MTEKCYTVHMIGRDTRRKVRTLFPCCSRVHCISHTSCRRGFPTHRHILAAQSIKAMTNYLSRSLSADDVIVVVGDAVGPLLALTLGVPPLVELGPHLADLALREELLVRLEARQRRLPPLVRPQQAVDRPADPLKLLLCDGMTSIQLF